MTEHHPTVQTIQAALANVCNGASGFVWMGNDAVSATWKCKDCGQVLKVGHTVSLPTWTHYKPGQELSYSQLQRRSLVEKHG